MKRFLLRGVLAVLVLVLLVVLAAAGAGAWLWFQPAPALEGEARVQGLNGPVDIVRDEWGVPHVYAGTELDAYYGLGWAVAQDRLFQLVLYRHLGQGRTAELVGGWEPVVRLDRLLRTLGVPALGRRMYQNARPEVKAALTAYYRGVNAYLAQRPDPLPLELRLLGWLGHETPPFEPNELAGMVGVMGLRLDTSWRWDVLYERLAAQVGRERAEALFPLSRGGTPSVFPNGGGVTDAAAAGPGAPQAARMAEAVATLPDLQEDLPAWLAPFLSFGASNNWAVAPRKAANGAALLASDPHLGLSLPDTWYLAHLKAGDFEVAGATFPGMPFVVIGHNTHAAWGMTNLSLDGGDFFLERLNPSDPQQVEGPQGWQSLRSRTETIRGWWNQHAFTVREGPNGPLVTDLLDEKGRELVPEGHALAFRWAPMVDPGANELDAFYRVNKARTWQDFRRALRSFSAIAQNFVYADAAGNIGMQVAGSVPDRPGDGKRFRRGWVADDAWNGILPFERLPRAANPPRGWTGSANNPTFPAPGPYYVSSYFEPGQRMERIGAVLSGSGPFTAADMRKLQLDERLPLARELVEQLLAAYENAPPADGSSRLGLAVLQDWSGTFTAQSPAPTVFAYTYWKLRDAVFADELGPLSGSYRGYPSHAALEAVVRGGMTDWLDDTGTPETEALPDVLRRAYADGMAALVDDHGEDPADWLWGDLHTLALQHPLGRIAGLGPLFNAGPAPVGGHELTLHRMGFRDGGWRVSHGASARIVVDFADLEQSTAVLPGGQSGVPGARHYADQFPLYVQGETIPLHLNRDAVEAGGARTYRLRRAGP